ncbi:MAG: hypothetical protein K2M91_00290 [Lachnospiraceae bacterium]|nr:hypothetical protein [Lachnospiraceae bacterium]
MILFLGKKINENHKVNPVELQTEDLSKTTTNPDEIDKYYGCYRVTQFYPTMYYNNVKYDCLPEQEADMMLGRIVIIESKWLVTYDSERRLGTREGRDGFAGNYIIEKYTIENPQYVCQAITSDTVDVFLRPDQDMKRAIGKILYEQIEYLITIPPLCSPFGTQYYYTLSNANQMIMYSTLSGQYFLMERFENHQKTASSQQLSDTQKNQLLKEIFGIYEVTAFLPTKFYPAKDSSGNVILPQEEADMMIGQEIIIREELFNTYDNDRRPNSCIANRLENDFWIKRVEIDNPKYRIERRFRKDIYGLRDNMLPEEFEQQEYIEIDIYPGYYAGDNTLPQLFVTENKKIIMYAMGEYFLLERKSI